MRHFLLTALGAAALTLAAPATAQDLPVVPGNFWNVTEVSVEDGHFGTYADYLAGEFRRNMEFQKSKGWIKDYFMLSNSNQRVGEPDLYLVTVMDRIPTAAEDMAREKELNAFMARDSRQAMAGSGQRAKYRKILGSILLQEVLWRR